MELKHKLSQRTPGSVLNIHRKYTQNFNIQDLVLVFAYLTIEHLFGHPTIALGKGLPLEVKFLAK